MLFVTEGKVLIEEKPEEETGIVVDHVDSIIRGLVKNICYYSSDYDSTSSAMNQAVRQNDVIWFDKRDALQMPFNKKLFVMRYKDVLVIEREDVKE